MNFKAYQVAVLMLEAARPQIAALRRVNADLSDQMERAATSVLLNIAEGSRRQGKDRTFHFRVADGSNAEVRAELDAAVALGQLDDAAAAPARELLDRCAAILWRLTHPR